MKIQATAVLLIGVLCQTSAHAQTIAEKLNKAALLLPPSMTATKNISIHNADRTYFFAE